MEGIVLYVLNKQLHTASKGWSSSLGVGWGAVYYPPRKLTMLQNHSQRSGILGPKRNKAVGVQKTTWWGALWPLLLTKYYLGEKSRRL